MTPNRWTTELMPPQAGRVALITGANSGLGLAAARALAAAGATTILACRSPENAERARRELVAAFPQADVQVGMLDVASLKSVRAFAKEVRQRFEAIDLLINNAGIFATPHWRSPDGFELQFATNHLGHFALTGLLLPQLAASAGSRVVVVSSVAARSGHIEFDDLMGERRYDSWQAYSQSKLANLMFALELQRRLQSARRPTMAVAAHPGFATTNLLATPGGFFLKRVVSPLMKHLTFQPAEQGVLPILFAATSPDAEPGGYYGPQGFREMNGPPGPAAIPDRARDRAAAARLWEVSERLAGISYP